MKLATAQLSGGRRGDDRIFSSDNALIMLDGASAFKPVPVPAAVYAETLGSHLREELADQPAADLVKLLEEAIAWSAKSLDLRAGNAPSSTVSIVRQSGESVDLLVLGDNLIASPAGEVCDTRLDALGLEPRTRYRDRLAAGGGYDDHHKALLRELQEQQAEWRNRDGGYWIAEADPAAAHHAITRSLPIGMASWVITATDGAYEPLEAVDPGEWSRFADWTSVELAELLRRLHRWEHEVDPEGRSLPRAKRHDDKSIAVVHFDV
ncbi:hypothetical protein AB0F15_00310 [Amycolatopsis sp. NPDC026612]|uniref:hypothetical protein n=1 Tax=Amycolatopsis sp. NPDC026612 TaxID=3155466 RepID=UPI00340F9DF7